MEKIINILLLLLLLISCIFNVILVNRLDESINVILETKLTDYETVDTIFFDNLVFDTVFLEKFDTVRLTKCQIDTVMINDSILVFDSVDVVLPIEVKHYSDTIVNTAISFGLQGYNCKIKDLYVHNFLNVPTQEKAVNNWWDNFGVGIGIGMTYIDRFRLVPNVGIYYKIF